MEFLIELLLELILEGSVEISSNKKISKWIRYPLIFILILFFGGIIFGLFVLGIISFKDNLCVSLLIIFISVILLINSILKFKKIYIEIEKNHNIHIDS